MTHRVLWALVVLAAAGCNCEELLATKRETASGPVVVRPEASGEPTTRPMPVGQILPTPRGAAVPMVPPPPPSVPVAAPVPAPAPVTAAEPTPLPVSEVPTNDAPPEPSNLAPSGPGARPLRPIRFPNGMARGLFERVGPTLRPPPSVVNEARSKQP